MKSFKSRMWLACHSWAIPALNFLSLSLHVSYGTFLNLFTTTYLPSSDTYLLSISSNKFLHIKIFLYSSLCLNMLHNYMIKSFQIILWSQHLLSYKRDFLANFHIDKEKYYTQTAIVDSFFIPIKK